jgi:hypothetical protein
LPELENREADNWRVLRRIAALAGEEWVRRADPAARYAAGQSGTVGDIVPLLEDIKDAWGTKDRIESRVLIDLLLALPEPHRDWGSRTVAGRSTSTGCASG